MWLFAQAPFRVLAKRSLGVHPQAMAIAASCALPMSSAGWRIFPIAASDAHYLVMLKTSSLAPPQTPIILSC
ncbi:MAG: hypothetical protein D6814_18235 [Calditrichaeota bacterium]|nr:MAG: hypothetical protein D6814_18235 [Calditrichota bacterium]